MAIIFSQPNAEGLSRSGRELLYEESVRYTKILFNYHQRLYGNFEGAKRLDECFSLINKSFENARTFKELRKYQRDSYTNDTLFMICPNFYDLILENKD
uniref:NR LBD domain-containing protein n=1 Tax=Meloidogyne hapla TaxID=6305 RepID=A0A1I8BB55_MELHA